MTDYINRHLRGVLRRKRNSQIETCRTILRAFGLDNQQIVTILGRAFGLSVKHVRRVLRELEDVEAEFAARGLGSPLMDDRTAGRICGAILSYLYATDDEGEGGANE